MTPELLLILAFVALAASGVFAYLAYRIWKKKEGEEAAGAEATDIVAGEAAPELARAALAPEAKTAAAPPAPAPPALPAGIAPPGPAPHDRAIPVAMLLRDEVTGGLIIRVGDREYRAASELLASKDRQRMEYTAADLSRWLGIDKTTAAPRPAPPEPPAKAPVPTRRPTSMVEQINAILDRKLLEKPQLTRGVRLAELPGGGIKVYIGIDSYNAIDDVPDTEIRQLIREAVAEWEAGE